MVTAVGNSTTPQTSTQTSQSALAGTFDTFLKLLTAQLQNQDPLSPMDSAKFTEQLVQYSQVEQQISTNKKLDALATTMTASGTTGSLSYLGKTALIDSNVTSLKDDKATWQYALGATSAKTAIIIKDAKGNTVYTAPGEQSAGTHKFTWDGKRTDGSDAPDGLYTMTVTATDSEKNAVESAIAVSERITGVDFSSTTPAVTTASGSHALSKIMRIEESAS